MRNPILLTRTKFGFEEELIRLRADTTAKKKFSSLSLTSFGLLSCKRTVLLYMMAIDISPFFDWYVSVEVSLSSLVQNKSKYRYRMNVKWDIPLKALLKNQDENIKACRRLLVGSQISLSLRWVRLQNNCANIDMNKRICIFFMCSPSVAFLFVV